MRDRRSPSAAKVWGLFLTQLWLLYLVRGHFQHSGLTGLLESLSARALGFTSIELTVMAGFLFGALALGGAAWLLVATLHKLGLRPGALRDLVKQRIQPRPTLALALSAALGAGALVSALSGSAPRTEALVAAFASALFAAQMAHALYQSRKAP